jgi:hypothetical protein
MGAGSPGWSSRPIKTARFADSFKPNLGFHFRAEQSPRYVAVPYWALALTPLLPCAPWVLGRRRRLARQRVARGLCPDCGYDVRATPHQCPECGGAFHATPLTA